MGLRFSRRVTLFPGVRLNFSRSGISASIGPRGASVTVGPHGAGLNLGIPGTGISFRQQLTGTKGRERNPKLPDQPGYTSPIPSTTEYPIVPGAATIQSAPVAELTSGNLESLKDLIQQALSERKALRRSIPVTRQELDAAKRRLRQTKHWFFRLFLKKKIPERKAQVDAKTAQLQKQEERLNGAFIDTEFALDETTREAFEKVTREFEAVAECEHIWDITSDCVSDRKVTRSLAAHSLDRTPVRFLINEDPVLQSAEKVLQLENAIGADLLVYPGFILMHDGDDLALIDLREVKITYHQSRFLEKESLSADAVVVGHTWAKCNKDGSPDRRFANNYRIPIVTYGGLILESTTGLNVRYQFSSAEKAERFAEALTDYQAKLRLLGERAPGEPRSTVPNDRAALSARAPKDGVLLKCFGFLQSSSAASPKHAIDIVRQFAELLKAEVDGFSGEHSCQELETLVNELARVPNAVRSFVRRTIPEPIVKKVEEKLLHGIKVLIGSVYRQMCTALEPIEAKSEAIQRLHRLVCEAENVLRR